MAYEFIIYEKKDHVAYITLNRPDRRNAISPPMQLELWDALHDFRDDPDAWVAILTGAGDRAFCAGADLKWSAENPGEPLPWKRDYRSDPERVGSAGNLPTELWKPIIAAVNGYAVGGGMEMTLHCDVIIASDNAQFGVPEIRQAGGLPGGGGMLHLPRQVPYRVAMWMILSGEFMSAEYMHSVGYVNEVVPQDRLMETAERYARTLCGNPPDSRAGRQGGGAARVGPAHRLPPNGLAVPVGRHYGAYALLRGCTGVPPRLARETKAGIPQQVAQQPLPATGEGRSEEECMTEIVQPANSRQQPPPPLGTCGCWRWGRMWESFAARCWRTWGPSSPA